MIADTSTFALGAYTVMARPRADSPAWLVYLVFRGPKLIGKSFSMPDEGCCRWLENSGGSYATPSGKPLRHTTDAAGARGGGGHSLSKRRNAHRS